MLNVKFFNADVDRQTNVIQEILFNDKDVHFMLNEWEYINGLLDGVRDVAINGVAWWKFQSQWIFLINPIDSLVRTLQIGFDVVTLTHLKLVYNKSSCDQHGLELEDTNQKDQWNWELVQRIR